MFTENDYREVRYVLLDTVAGKAVAMIAALEETEKQVTDLTSKLVAQTRALPDAKQRVETEDTMHDQLAKTIAGLTAAQERVKEALFHAATALHHGNAINMINFEAIHNES
ncbi:coat protein [Xanthomonas phage XAP3]|nr:coat protein [Xanthomonas phage XAP3]